MTKGEFGEIARMMKGVYNAAWFLPDMSACDAWYILVSEMDAKRFTEAFERYARENDNPPTPGGIIKHYMDIERERKRLKRDIMDIWETLRFSYEHNGGVVEDGCLRRLYETQISKLPMSEQLRAMQKFAAGVYLYMGGEDHLPTMREYIEGVR